MSGKKYDYIVKTFRYNGKQYKVYGKTEEEAITKKVETLAELKRGEKTSGGNMTVNRWFEEWMELFKVPQGLTAKSLGMYREKYEKYIKPYIGHMKLKDVRDTHLQRILNQEADRSYSHLTKLRAVMMQMFSRARKSRYITYDPAEDLVLPSTTKGTRRSLTELERAALLACWQNTSSGLFWFAMLNTGMRPGELTALQWRDVDFDRMEITVSRTIESGTDKQLKAPKTAAGIRTIPITSELAEYLKPLQSSPTTPVFLNQHGNMHTTASRRRSWNSLLRAMDIYLGAKLYRNAIVESKLADDLVPYCLRHTFCTDLQAAGVPINVAKELMGHSDISVTANIYTHRDNDTLHNSISKLSSYRSVKKPRDDKSDDK